MRYLRIEAGVEESDAGRFLLDPGRHVESEELGSFSFEVHVFNLVAGQIRS